LRSEGDKHEPHSLVELDETSAIITEDNELIGVKVAVKVGAGGFGKDASTVRGSAVLDRIRRPELTGDRARNDGVHTYSIGGSLSLTAAWGGI
jgi:hypothetical protein